MLYLRSVEIFLCQPPKNHCRRAATFPLYTVTLTLVTNDNKFEVNRLAW
jgi:hypothetical protein